MLSRMVAAAATGAVLTLVGSGSALAAPTAFVTDGNASVFPVDVATGVPGERIALTTGETQLVVASPDGKTIYTLGASPGLLSVIDAATRTVKSTITIGTVPAGLAITPDGTKLYVTRQFSRQLIPVDAATGATGPAITTGNGPRGIAITPDGTKVVVTNYSGSQVQIVSVATGAVLSTIPVPGNPQSVVITPDGKTAWAFAETNKQLVPIDLATATAGTPIVVGGTTPRTIALAPDGTSIYVSDWASGDLTPFDLATGAPRTPIVSLGATSVAFTPDGKTGYAPGGMSGKVFRFDVATGALGTPIELGNSPAYVAFSNVTPTEQGPPAPTYTLSHEYLSGTVGDPTNDRVTITVAQKTAAGGDVDASALRVEAVLSSNPAVAALSGVTVSGMGATRSVSITPAGGVGYADIALRVSGLGTETTTAIVNYAASGAAPTATSRSLIGSADASAAIDAGDGYMLVADDESNIIKLFKRDSSERRVKDWDFQTRVQAPREVDIEAATRVGDTIYWSGSLGNNKEGKLRPERAFVFTTVVSGSGASTELTFGNRYAGLRDDLIEWDQAHGNRFGFAAGAAEGKIPKILNGFNVEGLEFAPGSTSVAYVGFRAPLVPAVPGGKALVVPVLNFDQVASASAKATFGEPILWDLGGLSIRDIRKNALDQYLVLAGSYDAGGRYELWTWDGVSSHAPRKSPTPLPALDTTGEDPGAWEAIVDVPAPLRTGAPVQLLMDQGAADLYHDGQEAKSLNPEWSKGRSDWFSLELPTDITVGLSGTVPLTLGLSLGSGSASFGTFLPGVGRDYVAPLDATVTATAEASALTVYDPSSVVPGRLVNGTRALATPVAARAGTGAFAPVGSAAVTLGAWTEPVSNEPVALEFRQSIGAREGLSAGEYGKTLVFLLAQTTP
ncbi:YncE family protein [Solirubrobacter phytolaccae]|uniref:YncE family protein n=1 Tax=Solirubrobacter phytolaccae TaxID=1404360 RepID=A0A9X3NAZ5_9ACTN|nr:YncE family protein [Solirubrobacter phytolaccae]MDA0181779.1 YncE family protein [Solirubrobacter phytolaccae]